MAGILNRDLLAEKIREAKQEALHQISVEVQKVAKAKAPVRRVEPGPRAKYKEASHDLRNLAFKAAREYKYRSNRQRTAAEARTKALTSLYSKRLGGYARERIRRRGDRASPLVLGTIRRPSDKTVNVTGVRGGPRATIAGKQNFTPTPGVGGRRTLSGQYVASPDFAAKLSARGRYELRRKKNSALVIIDSEGKIAKQGRLQIGGRLRASIEELEIEVGTPRSRVVVGTTVPYALYVEFPTSHNAAQPFLLPALKSVKKRVKPILKAALREQKLSVRG